MISPPFSRQQHVLYNKTAEEDLRACGAVTPYLVLETSTSGLVLKRPVPSEVPSMQTSSISCRASRQCCPRFATGGVMIWCWRSWQRWQSHAYRRLTADPPLRWNFQSCLQGLGRTPTPLDREKMQDSSQPAVFPREIIKASLYLAWPGRGQSHARPFGHGPVGGGLGGCQQMETTNIYIYIYIFYIYFVWEIIFHMRQILSTFSLQDCFNRLKFAQRLWSTLAVTASDLDRSVFGASSWWEKNSMQHVQTGLLRLVWMVLTMMWRWTTSPGFNDSCCREKKNSVQD